MMQTYSKIYAKNLLHILWKNGWQNKTWIGHHRIQIFFLMRIFRQRSHSSIVSTRSWWTIHATLNENNFWKLNYELQSQLKKGLPSITVCSLFCGSSSTWTIQYSTLNLAYIGCRNDYNTKFLWSRSTSNLAILWATQDLYHAFTVNSKSTIFINTTLLKWMTNFEWNIRLVLLQPSKDAWTRK